MERDQFLEDVMDYTAIKMLTIAIDTILLHITYKKKPEEALKMLVRLKMLILAGIDKRREHDIDREIQETIDKIFRDYEEKQEREDKGKGPKKDQDSAPEDNGKDL